MATWQLTYGGTTQDAAVWGISKLKRKRKSAATDTVTFSFDGMAIDTAPPFAIWQPVTITKNGAPWFMGYVTRMPRKATGTAEALDYEISGPWYWLEQTVFQQMWVTSSTTSSLTAVTTARSSVILGSTLPGVKIHSGQIMVELLIYAQYAFQGQPFPTTPLTAAPTGVRPSYWPSLIPTTYLLNLPPPPNPANGPLPFLIGAIDPTIVIPYTQQRDKSCAAILKLLLKYTPDAVTWFDYTTSPPTLNIQQRASLPSKTVSVLSSAVVNGFNPTPRYDIQVPAVIVKFEETFTFNNVTYDYLVVDQYPSGVPDNTPRAWIQTISLAGGHVTTQTSQVAAILRPVAAGDTAAMSWIFKHEPWLNAPAPGSTTPLYDYSNISINYLNTVIDPDDPLNTSNPNNVSLPGCPQLVNELLSAFPGWLQDQEELDSARVSVEVWLQYSGTDPLTAALFTYDPTPGGTGVTAPGTGYLVKHYNIKATNASTESYTHVTSRQAGETAPTGFAQYLYNTLLPLHFDGDITFVESECSDPLPLGCTFNTTDGLALWQAMNALVLEVSEDIDSGTTTVTFGPPLKLGLDTLEELFRSNQGLRQTFQLSQRTGGQSGSDSSVTDSKHSGERSSTGPPTPGGSSTPFPFQVTMRANPSTPGEYQVMVNAGSSLFATQNISDKVAITGLGAWFNLDSNDTIWIYGATSVDANGLITVSGNAEIHSYGKGDSDFSQSALPWESGGIVECVAATSSTPATQTLFRKVIAVFIADNNGNPSLTAVGSSSAYPAGQYVSTNLVMTNESIGSSTTGPYPALYPEGW